MGFCLKTAGLGVFVILQMACAGSGTGLNFYSYEQEAQEGQKFASQIEKEMPIMQDPKLSAYITGLGRNLISKGLDSVPYAYTFQVVDSSEINAFAIPGGHLYVNLGLLKEVKNEAELIGVIGHEIGHVVHRHGTKRMTDAVLLQVAAVGTAAALGKEKNGELAGMGVILFGQVGLLKYGRQAELESDRTGVDILYRTGYDVSGMSSFFEKLQAIENQHGAKRGGLSELLSTHPPTKDRIHEASEYSQTLPKQNSPRYSSPEFEEIRSYIAPMTPSKPQQRKT